MTLRRQDKGGAEQKLIKLSSAEESRMHLNVMAQDMVVFRYDIRWLKDGFIAKKGDKEVSYWVD
jgi:hypothetical protein